MSIILRQNENLVKVVRKHIMFLMPVFFSWPLIIIALLLVRYWADFDFFGYWPLVMVVFTLIVAVIVLYKFYIWRMDALIITNQRVVENSQHGFFSKTVTELLFHDILEISYQKNGLNASLYDFGDVKFRTAAENEIVIEQIPDPDSIVELINGIRQAQPAHA